MSFKSDSYQNLGQTMIKKFARRGINAVYCPNREDAAKTVLSLIPEKASVTWGGSETIKECGIPDLLTENNREIIDRATAVTPEEQRAMFARQAMADYFLMSTNAFTEDGELVNMDGRGNRVAFLISGPEHVIVVTGMNKLTRDVRDAVHRIQSVATPPNCVRLQRKTPCAATGLCGDCHSADTICCQLVITRHSMIPGRITVVMVGEDLGF